MDITMNRNYNPGRSPLLGIAAVVATAVTLGLAVLLPANLAPHESTLAATTQPQRADAQLSVRVVMLPAIEVVATRPAKTARIQPVLPAAYKREG